MPLHRLELQVIAQLILLRNLNSTNGLCNGTRLIVRELKPHLIVGEILYGARKGDVACIPRITLAPTDTTMPFTLSRRQFPVRLAYCVTISKAQGQSFTRVWLYCLPQNVIVINNCMGLFHVPHHSKGWNLLLLEAHVTKPLISNKRCCNLTSQLPCCIFFTTISVEIWSIGITRWGFCFCCFCFLWFFVSPGFCRAFFFSAGCCSAWFCSPVFFFARVCFRPGVFSPGVCFAWVMFVRVVSPVFVFARGFVRRCFLRPGFVSPVVFARGISAFRLVCWGPVNIKPNVM